jgi:prepilin-type N-terminal cleavage/methylation domain-containing protein
MKKGFTLIEIIVSLFIFSVGIAGILFAFSLGVKIESKAKMRTCASKLAQERIEEIASLPYEEIISSFENYGDISDFNSYKRRTDVYYYNPDSLSTSTVDSGIKMIEVSVFWDSPVSSVEKNINFNTLVHE